MGRLISRASRVSVLVKLQIVSPEAFADEKWFLKLTVLNLARVGKYSSRLHPQNSMYVVARTVELCHVFVVDSTIGIVRNKIVTAS